jgi:hypothetical protein
MRSAIQPCRWANLFEARYSRLLLGEISRKSPLASAGIKSGWFAAYDRGHNTIILVRFTLIVSTILVAEGVPPSVGIIANTSHPLWQTVRVLTVCGFRRDHSERRRHTDLVVFTPAAHGAKARRVIWFVFEYSSAGIAIGAMHQCLGRCLFWNIKLRHFTRQGGFLS